MNENIAGSRKFPMAANTRYMRTRMNAPAIGLITLYRRKRAGSVQFESISQPSHAAHLNVRQYIRAFAPARAPTDAVTSASPRAARASRGTQGRSGPG